MKVPTDSPHASMGLIFLALWCQVAAGVDRFAITYLDWDVIISVVLGLAAIGFCVLEYRRTSRLDDWSQVFAERIATLEAQLASTNPQTLPERVASLEAVAGEAPDTTSMLSRLAALEVERASAEDVACLRERVSIIETRIDFKQITHTRNAKGKFASPEEKPTP